MRVNYFKQQFNDLYKLTESYNETKPECLPPVPRVFTSLDLLKMWKNTSFQGSAVVKVYN